MDENQAWAYFAQTGRIEDYIRYAQIKNRAGGRAPIPQEVHRAAQEGQHPDKNPGPYYPGTAGG